jgi:HupE / UreJ protein
MVAADGRWRARRGAKATLMRLLGIVSAFTVGHSGALVVAAASGWQVAARGIETLIALSVLLSALHAWRPIFPGREAVVAGAFGLCHGLAFARALSGHLPDPVDTAGAILGFNLGIECFQILIVLASIPFVIQLAPAGFGGAARRLLAACAAVAALAWLAERALDAPNPLSTALGSVTMSTTLIVVGATLGAGASLSGVAAWRRRRAQVVRYPQKHPSKRWLPPDIVGS